MHPWSNKDKIIRQKLINKIQNKEKINNLPLLKQDK